MLWAFDPVKYCSAAPALVAGNQPQVGLESAPQHDARLGVAVREHPLDLPVAGERVHQRRRGAGGEDVEIAAGLAAAPQAADHGDHRAGRRLAERADERRRRVVGLGDQPPAGDPGALLEGAQDLGFLLRAHALERAQPPFACRRLRARRASGSRAGDRAARPSSDRRPAGAAGRGWSAETPGGDPGDRRWRRSRPARRFSRRGPCRCRAAPAVPPGASAATRSGWCAMVSEALRYARILNGFSFLISSRSPISASTRAIARLSMQVARMRVNTIVYIMRRCRFGTTPASGPARARRVRRPQHPRRSARAGEGVRPRRHHPVRAQRRVAGAGRRDRARGAVAGAASCRSGSASIRRGAGSRGCARRSRCGRRCTRSAGAATRRWRRDSRRALAAELRAVGVTLDFTPVLDILTNPKNPGDRRSGAGEHARGRRPARGGHHRDPAGGGHRRLRQAFSRARRHQRRLPSRDAARSSIRPIGWRRSSSCRSRRRLPPASPAS